MVARPTDAIFQITRITVVTSGTPSTTIDAHATARHGEPSDVIAVTIGDVLIYCHDRATVHGFTCAWADAARTLPAGLPDRVQVEVETNRRQVGVVLRVAGTRAFCVGVGADANPTGRPFVRVTVGPLTVHAFDRAAVTGWAEAGALALRVADRFWPAPDTFDDAEARARRRVLTSGPQLG